MPTILMPFRKFASDALIVGRLLAGYSTIELTLMYVVMGGLAGNFDAAIKGIFKDRGESKRLRNAKSLAQAHYASLGLGADSDQAIQAVRRCLDIRNQYAHWIWWDDYSGKLAFANLEQLARWKRKVPDLSRLTAYHLDRKLLECQEAYFVYAEQLLAWINYEGRVRDGALPHHTVRKPRRPRQPAVRRR